jgi:hypothetical protein
MSGKYRADIEWEVVNRIDIEDSDNEKEYVPIEIVKDTLSKIEDDIGNIQYLIRNVDGLDLIDEVKSKLEELYEKIY